MTKAEVKKKHAAVLAACERAADLSDTARAIRHLSRDLNFSAKERQAEILDFFFAVLGEAPMPTPPAPAPPLEPIPPEPIRREVRHCGGVGKRGYRSEAALKRARAKLRSGIKIRGYRCELCGDWHMAKAQPGRM